MISYETNGLGCLFKNISHKNGIKTSPFPTACWSKTSLFPLSKQSPHSKKVQIDEPECVGKKQTYFRLNKLKGPHKANDIINGLFLTRKIEKCKNVGKKGLPDIDYSIRGDY